MRLSTIPILFLCLSLHAQNFVWGHSPPAVAPGGIAIVSVTTNYLATTGTSLSMTIPATTAGHLLAILNNTYHGHLTGCTTNGVSVGAAFQITTNAYIGAAGTFSYTEGYFIKNCGAGINTVVLTVTADGANTGFISPTIIEVSGLSTTAPYTATERIATVNGTGNVSTQDTGGQINNGTTDSIYFAVFGSDGNGVITTINATGSDGTWIEPPNSRQTGAVAQEMCVVYQIVSSSAARKAVVNRVNNANGTTAFEFVLH